MSWQEKIERYQEGQQRAQEEAARLQREEKLRIAKEKIPPLLEALKTFNCEELLLQIRDDIWKLGDVSTTPDLDNLTPDTPIEARAILIARWPYYQEGGSTPEYYWGEVVGYRHYDPQIEIHAESLEISARYDSKGNIYLILDPAESPENPPGLGEIKVDIREQNAAALLETLLTKDCIDRQKGVYAFRCPPLTKHKKEAELQVIGAMRDNALLKPPKGFEYLLDLTLAEKARLGAGKTQTEQPTLEVSEGGFWRRLFGKQ